MDKENFPAPVETIIRDALPEESDREHRICLLRLWHAAERAQWELDSFGSALADYLRDPDPLTSARILAGNSDALARKMITFAAEVKKSLRSLERHARQRYEATKPRSEEAGA